MKPTHSSADSLPGSPPPRSRHSTRSFTSLAPSDSRSNYPPPLQHLSLQQQSRTPSKLTPSHSVPSPPSSKPPFPVGTRPQDLDIASIEDPDDLFISFTIREIRSIEQRARADANQKREDLRQMVGERYRDLLGAADSIVRMKLGVESLLEKLEQARSESDRTLLKSRAEAAGNSHKRSTTGSSKLSYVLATLVRLLLDLSEHVWRSLEREDFLTASRYVSLGRIISNELTTGNWDETGETEPSEVVEMFPIVERQSETLGQLSPQISHKAKLFLRKWDIKNQAILEALAAVTLLDNTTLLDSLQLLLQVRKTVFRNLIASLSGSWTEHVKNAVKLLVATLVSVNQIFLQSDFVNLLKAIQDGSSKEMHLKPLFALLPNPHQLMRYVPKSIIDFCPFVAALAGSGGDLEPFPIAQSWFEACQIDLISYIDKKLGQVQTAESLVGFRHQLHQAIGQLDGPFESTIHLFRSKLITSLNRRFYELYQSRLNQLKTEIIECLLHPQLSKAMSNENEQENWVFNKKLPLLLEPNDPTKFTKYMNSIQNRIQGKVILQEESEKNLTNTKNSSIVSKIELVGKWLREDFKRWNKGVGGDLMQQSIAAMDKEDQIEVYVNLGNRFVEDFLKEINQVLKQEVEKSNLERELNVGNLALQILSTRNTFMMDLSLTERDNENDNPLIQKFESGLNQIIFDSAHNWSQFIVEESVRLFNSSRLKSNQHQLNLEKKEGKSRTKPSDSMIKSLDLISGSMVTSLGVHRLKLQQSNLLSTLFDEFICRILDDHQFADFAKSTNQVSDDPWWEAVLFDLLFLFELVFHQDPSTSSKNSHSHQLESNKGFQKLHKLVELLTKKTEEKANDKVKLIKENVIKYKSTITRLWWPLILIQEPRERQEDDEKTVHSKLLIKDTSQLDTNKLPRFGGLACVKPGNRFALLSVY